jgi:sortase A
MTDRGALVLMRSVVPSWPERLPRLERATVPAPPEHRVVLSYTLTLVSVCVAAIIVHLTLVSQLQHFTAQNRLYDQLRLTLAEGSVPIGQLGVDGALVTPGTPVAMLSIPDLGVEEVVVEGTTSSETSQGVGHRRDTPLPGQPGVAVLMGRAAAYGGVFGDLEELTGGQELSVTTGQGVSTYRVIGPRTSTTTLPVLAPDAGRLTLITASGGMFRPTGVLRIDAELVSQSFPRPPVAIGAGMIPDAEQALAGDRSHAFVLSWLLELLLLLGVAAVWSWKRWRHAATWLVFVPVLGAAALATAGNVCLMLPNLI